MEKCLFQLEINMVQAKLAQKIFLKISNRHLRTYKCFHICLREGGKSDLTDLLTTCLRSRHFKLDLVWKKRESNNPGLRSIYFLCFGGWSFISLWRKCLMRFMFYSLDKLKQKLNPKTKVFRCWHFNREDKKTFSPVRKKIFSCWGDKSV